MEFKLIDSTQVATKLGIAKRTLERMRQDGRFPQPHGQGKLMRWLEEEVDAYIIFYAKLSNKISSSKLIDKNRLIEIKKCAEKAAH